MVDSVFSPTVSQNVHISLKTHSSIQTKGGSIMSNQDEEMSRLSQSIQKMETNAARKCKAKAYEQVSGVVM